ncbi:MAG: T9SS type A sorting domain-containing protein [Flavobacteriaceae bacterium]|nr:T9SS type A sorting domain-containing protein [Flavobacteriaceae bacterium]
MKNFTCFHKFLISKNLVSKKLLLFTTLCLTFSVNAQIAFSEVQTNTNNPFLAMNSTSIAYGDIDGDDDLDVVICGSQNTTTYRTVLYRNNGLGIYTEDTSNTLLNISGGKVALKDLDGDSDKDLILAGYNSSNIWVTKIYENNGTGSFSEITNPNIVPFYQGTYALADVDGDNDLDLLTTGRISASGNAFTKMYTNNGFGVFTEVLGTSFSGAYNGSSINFADIDGDNDQDVFITASDTGSAGAKLYTNNGTGVFTEVVGTSISPTFFAGVQFEDVDSDGDQDLIIVDGYGGKVYLNNGVGIFTEDTSTNIIGLGNSTLVFSDVDGDNDKDFYLVGRNPNNGNAVEGKIYKNDGIGGFTEEVAVIIEPAYSSTSNSNVAFFDKEDDGDDDLLIIGYNPSFINVANLYENDGSGNFTSIYNNTSVINVTISKNVFADIDNDGDQDLLIAGYDGTNRITKLYDNDGTGQFSENTLSTFDNISNPSIAFADVDNDSDLDLFVSGLTDSNAISKLYTNNGSGVFTEVTSQSFTGIYSGTTVFEDIDNDNDLDLILIGTGDLSLESIIYLNNGLGVFSATSSNPFVALDSPSISFADIDNDGNKDVILSGRDISYVPITKLYLSNGIGGFTEVTGTGLENIFGKSLFSDIDSDGDQDLLLSGYNDSNVPSSKLYSNNGSGVFSEIVGAGIQAVGYNDAVFTDIDNDSDSDILIVGYNGSVSVAKLYLNDGSGSFTELTGLPFAGVTDGSVAIADFNGDNKKDVLISGNSFGTISTKRYINDSTLSTSNYSFNKNQISLFPNPTNNHFQIETTETLGRVEVYSLQGQLVKSFVPQSQYDISGLSSGIYIVKIKSNDSEITKRIIKE